MTAKIIVVANQKGGVGKTSITMALASTLALRKSKVLVVDGDQQGTATRWSASSPEDTPWPTAVVNLAHAGGKIHQEMRKFVDDFDFIVVDCPPAAESPVAQSALLVADICVVPLIPSPPDAWAAIAIQRAIEQASVTNDSLQAITVLNQFQRQTAVAKEMARVLPDFGFPTANTTIGQRTSFRESAALGVPLQALGRSAKAAIAEIEALTDELLNHLTVEPSNS